MLGPRLGEQGVLEGAAPIGHAQQVVEARRQRDGHGHTSAARSASRRFGQAEVRLATTGHAMLGANPARLGGHRPASARLGQDPAQGRRQRVGVVVVDDDAGAAGQQLDGVREGGGDDRPAGGDGVDEDAGGDLSVESYGSTTTAADWISSVSDATSR